MKVKNLIPPMTDPQGRYWDQPPTEDILIDDTHAVMNRKTFEQLEEYNCTLPTGVYPGKMWRYNGMAYHNYPHHLLRWYDHSTIGPGYCSNEQRIILICD